MRVEVWSFQQALTTESANVVKQAVILARRRGHAQVTPLHMASTMLTTPNSLLRLACIKCQSHTLQCRALDLCFNVALNRLPTTPASIPLLGHYHCIQPSISNSLVAAFKRAQAHYRRGAVEHQQQQILAPKVELQQLVISILDDPSVSRVMKEAGFSSTHLKVFTDGSLTIEDRHFGSLDLSLNLNSNIEDNFSCKYISRPNFAHPTSETSLGNFICCFDCSSKCAIDSNVITELSGNMPKIEILEGIPTREMNRKWNTIYRSFQKTYLSDVELTLGTPTNTLAMSKEIEGVDDRREIPKFGWLNEESSEQKPELLSNPNSSPNSATSSEALDGMDCPDKFDDLNHENMKAFCEALEAKVPRQKDIIPDIASAILQSRSEEIRRKRRRSSKCMESNETWLMFLGLESEGKERIAREIAKLIFGSYKSYIAIRLGGSSSVRTNSIEEVGNKRARSEISRSYVELFTEAVLENPHRVLFLEDIDRAECSSQIGIKRAIESGTVPLPSGEFVPLQDAIIIIATGSWGSFSRSCYATLECVKIDEEKERHVQRNNKARHENRSSSAALDLNVAFEGENEEYDSTAQMDILELLDRRFLFKTRDL